MFQQSCVQLLVPCLGPYTKVLIAASLKAPCSLSRLARNAQHSPLRVGASRATPKSQTVDMDVREFQKGCETSPKLDLPEAVDRTPSRQQTKVAKLKAGPGKAIRPLRSLPITSAKDE